MRRKSKVVLSFFPIISVLSALIAVLMMFIIVTLGTRVIDTEIGAARAKSPFGAGSRGPGPGSVEEESGLDKERYLLLQQMVDELAGLLAQRRRERVQLERKQQELIDLIESKKTELLVVSKPDGMRRGVQLGVPLPVDVVPSKEVTVTKMPVLVEVKAEGYVHHRKDTEGKHVQDHYPPLVKETIKDKGGPKDVYRPAPKLKAFIDRVDTNRRKEYLLLLLHPNGVENYRSIRTFLADNYREPYSEIINGKEVKRERERIGLGYEPFAPEWTVFTK